MNQATAAALAPSVATGITLPGVPRIGTPWEGQAGRNGGIMRGEDGAPDYFLIAVDSALAKHDGIAYGSYGIRTVGADHKYDGLANMRAMLESGNDHPLATWAASVTIDGFSDLYPPSIMELAQLRVTCPALFEGGGWWLSSTQYSADNAWFQYFGDGGQYGGHKGGQSRARLVRRLIIQPFGTSVLSSSVAA